MEFHSTNKLRKFTKDRVLNTLRYFKNNVRYNKRVLYSRHLLHYPETVLFHFVTVDGERAIVSLSPRANENDVFREKR